VSAERVYRIDVPGSGSGNICGSQLSAGLQLLHSFPAVKPKQYKKSKRKGSLRMVNGRNYVKSCMLNCLGLLFAILDTSTYAFVELLHFSSNSCKYF